MNDKIVKLIISKNIDTENISFDLIRKIAGKDYDIWHKLGRGRAILNSEEELDQYLYSYGPMIKSQWDNLLSSMQLPAGNISIADYACGQGLASMLLLDKFRVSKYIEKISQITLIEPSAIALTRASRILNCYCPGSRITTINKKIDDLTQADLKLSEIDAKIHLFSNILDIDDFDQLDLFNKIFSNKGIHYILAVSHDRNFDGGSQRLRDVYNAIKPEIISS